MSDPRTSPSGTGQVPALPPACADPVAEHLMVMAQMDKDIAAMEAAAAQESSRARPVAAAGANRIGARQDASFKAISTAPSINKTPVGASMVPIPYPTVQDLSNSINCARSVRFNGKPVYLLDQTTQPKGTGDEPGVGKGIRSGTVTGEVKPVKGSTTVRIEGKRVVRDGDACTMNGGNNPGIYVTTPAPGCAIESGAPSANTDPPIAAQTPAEKSWLAQWWSDTKHEVSEAVAHPIDGVIGAAKGLANMPSSIGEMLIKGSALQSAAEMDQSAGMQALFGQTQAAQRMTESAQQVRSGANEIALPKFDMTNAAQLGGDKILTGASLLAAGAGLVKGGVKGLATIGKAAKVESAAGKGAAEAAMAVQAEHAAADVAKAADAAADGGAAARAAEVPAPLPAPAGDGVRIIEKIKSLRRRYVGNTPGKASRTGRDVQARMRADETLRDSALTGKPEFLAGDTKWYSLEYADMAHKQDAVTWWNTEGRVFGARAPEVRTWMLDSKNYVLEHRSINRSLGAQIGETYDLPLK